MKYWQGVIFGELASKANSRKLVTMGGRWTVMNGQRTRVGGRPAFIKSEKARAFEMAVQRQVPVLSPMLEGRLRLICKIFYASERPDLDESVLLDALQGRIYANDRQVREKHVSHAIDRDAPRAIVRVEEMSDLPLPANIRAQLTAPDDEREGAAA